MPAKTKGKRRTKGTGSIQRTPSGAWRIWITVEGVPMRLGPKEYPELRAGGFRTRTQVHEWLLRKLPQLTKEAGREKEQLEPPGTVSELFDQYEAEMLPQLAETTRRTFKSALKLFREFFVHKLHDQRVDRIRAPHVRRYLSWREQTTTPSARTLAKDRAMLHAIFQWAVDEKEALEANPVAKVKPPKVDKRTPVILDDAQFEALLAATEKDEHGRLLPEREMLKLYILTLGETGGRCDSEILWLRWQDVDLEGGFLKIESSEAKGRRTKGGKTRFVPMTARLRQAMREHVLRFRGAKYDGKPSPWVFHHLYSRRRAKAGERVRSFRRGFQAARARAKLPAELHQHDLRHRRVTSWLAAGKNPVHVKEAVGHADLRTTMEYTHLVPAHLRALVEEPDREDVRKELA